MDKSPDNGPCEVTITAPDRKWLETFVRQLVEDRLAAAAHVDVMHTTYRWQGDVHEAEEARAVLHSVAGNVVEISDRANQMHPFDVACVVSKSIVDGSAEYLSWIREQSTR